MNKILGDYTDLPFLSPDPKHNVRNAIDNFLTTQHFDWPKKLIAGIKKVMGTPYSTSSALKFKFKLSEEAMKHNLAVLEKYNYDLGQALDAQQDSPLGLGKAFILRSHFPKQMPENFRISPLPSEINSWLTSLLRQLPVNKKLWEQHMTMGLKLGSSGSNIASPLDAMTLILTCSVRPIKFHAGS